MQAKPYRRYKPSGVEWLGGVPDHWEVKRGRFAMLVNPPTPRLRALKQEDEVSFVPMEAVGVQGGLNLEQTRVLDEVSNGYTEFQDGDVVVAKITPCFENGKAALAHSLLNGAAYGTTELHVLRAGPTLDRSFLFYVAISDTFRKLGESEMYGAGGQKRVPPDFNKDFRMPLPPLPEQRAIAAFLDRETGRVDRLVAKKQKLIERLKEKRTALISLTVTRGLPPVAARAAGLPENPPLKPSGLDWLGDIPAYWDAKPLKFIALVKTGFAFSSDDFTDEGVPVLRIGDISRNGQIDFSDAKFLPVDFLRSNRDVIVRSGDIAMAMTGATIGKVGRYHYETPALLNQRVCLFRPMQGVSIDFLWYLLNTDFYIEHVLLTAFGGAQPNISDTQLLACSVPVPPLPEQTAIAAYLDEETVKLATLVGKAEAAVERLREYRIALITAAVTGKIDVRDQKS